LPQQSSVGSLSQQRQRPYGQGFVNRPRCVRTQSANFAHENELKNSRRTATRNSFSAMSSKSYKFPAKAKTSEELSV